jgi:hypothetical protein
LTASCEAPSCIARVDAQCPDVGGSQGQSQLLSCSGGTPDFDNDRCIIVNSGPPTGCEETLLFPCRCGCITVGGFFGCSCSCTPPGAVTCSSGVQTVTASGQAVCLAAEP